MERIQILEELSYEIKFIQRSQDISAPRSRYIGIPNVMQESLLRSMKENQYDDQQDFRNQWRIDLQYRLNG